MSQIVVAALYKFVALENYRELQAPLQALCKRVGIKGTLLIASEGINGTVSGSRSAVDALLEYLRRDPRLAGLEHKESFTDSQPFYRLKVKLKKEIVTLGVQGIDPNATVGTYVEPQHWNQLISDPEVTVIDTRNDYEYQIGSFAGAINPKTDSFRELPKFVADKLNPSENKKVAMFCTGGIRCEKSTALLKKMGFDEVYHLKGGILKYLEEVPEKESLWEGECFVFDNRVSVGHGLVPGPYELCHGCRLPIGAQDKLSPKYIEGVACANCYDDQTPQQRTRFAERQKQLTLAKQRGEQHIGDAEDIFASRSDSAK